MRNRLGVKEVAYTLSRRRCPYFKLKLSRVYTRRHDDFKEAVATLLTKKDYTLLGGAKGLAEPKATLTIHTRSGYRFIIEGRPDIVAVKHDTIVVVEVKSTPYELIAPIAQLSLYFAALDTAVRHAKTIQVNAKQGVEITGYSSIGDFIIESTVVFPSLYDKKPLENKTRVEAYLARPKNSGKDYRVARVPRLELEDPNYLKKVAENILEYVVLLRPVEEKRFIPGPYCIICGRQECPWNPTASK